MEINIIPRNAVRGSAAFNAIAPMVKRELKLAAVTAAAAGVVWKTYHWGVKRDIARVNKERLSRLQSQQKRYDDALSAELKRLGL